MTYGTATAFKTYHQERGNDVPGTWTDETVDAALLVASDWIDGIYGPSFIGYKTDGFLQSREWPRSDAVVTTSIPHYIYDSAVIPDRVKNATYEAAYRHLVTPGSLLVDYTPGKYKSVTIEGALSVDYIQFNSAADTQIQIRAVDNLLWPLLDASSMGYGSSLSGGVSRV